MRDESADLPPIRKDASGLPVYMPEYRRKWRRIERRQRSLGRADAVVPGQRSETPPTMTAHEWIRSRDRRYMLLDEIRDHVNAPLDSNKPRETVKLLAQVRKFWSKFADELSEEACGNIVAALQRIITDPKSTGADVNSAVAQMRGLLREAEEHLKGKVGAPAVGTVNLTQVNLVAELQKNPELVKLLVHEAGKMGLLEQKDAG